jgi:hypothetical protein
MTDDFQFLNAKLNQLIGRFSVQEQFLCALCSVVADRTDDWRDMVDVLQMMTEWNVQNLPNATVDEKAIRLEALGYYPKVFEQIFTEMLRQEQSDADKRDQPSS